jgi:hypothetical protein
MLNGYATKQLSLMLDSKNNKAILIDVSTKRFLDVKKIVHSTKTNQFFSLIISITKKIEQKAVLVSTSFSNESETG